MGTLHGRAPNLVAIVEKLAFAQPAPFSSASLADMAAGATGFSAADIEEILAAYRGVIRWNENWCSLRSVARVHHTATSQLESSHIAVTPQAAIAAAYSNRPRQDPAMLELAEIFLERSPDVPRHPNGQLAIQRRAFPDLAPVDPGPAEVFLGIGTRGGERTTAPSARESIQRWLTMQRLQLLTFRTQRERLGVMRAAPVKFRGTTLLTAWTPSITAARAERLSALGWWIWPSDTPRILSTPRHLEDMRPLPPGNYCAAVRTDDPLVLSTLLSTTLAHDFQHHATRYELQPTTVAPSGFFASKTWRALQDRIQNPVLDHCLACGRALTNPESARRGIGPECLERLTHHLGRGNRVDRILDDLQNKKPVWIAPLSVLDWRSMLLET